MNSDSRSRRRQLVEEAYNLQVKAGLTASRMHVLSCWLTKRCRRIDDSLRVRVCMPHLLVRHRDLGPISLPTLFNDQSPTARCAIWRIWSRLCNFRAPYLAHFPVSLSPPLRCATKVFFVFVTFFGQTPDSRIQGVSGFHKSGFHAQ